MLFGCVPELKIALPKVPLVGRLAHYPPVGKRLGMQVEQMNWLVASLASLPCAHAL